MKTRITWSFGLLATFLATMSPGSDTSSSQLAWLAGRVHPGTGLVDAFADGQGAAPLYANTLAVIAFSHAGKFDLAAGIIKTFEQVYTQSTIEGRCLGLDGLLYDRRPAARPFSGSGHFRTGENAWLVMAINYYESVSGDPRFAALATNLLEAICAYRNANPSASAYGAFRWNRVDASYATEFQLAIYAALASRGVLAGNTRYLQYAADLRRYLLENKGWPLQVGKTKVWLPFNEPLFNGKLYDGATPIYLDCQTWTVLALYPRQAGEPDFTRVLDSIDEGGAWQAIRETVICEGKSVTGFSDEFLPGGIDQDWVWLEGTEFMSAACKLVGKTSRFIYYHGQVAQLLREDGSLYHSCGNDGVYPDTQWPENYRVGSVTTTAWFYFVEVGLNPFQPPPARPRFLKVVRLMDGRIALSFSAVPGAVYTLRSAPSVEGPWTDMQLVTADSTRMTVSLDAERAAEFFSVSRAGN